MKKLYIILLGIMFFFKVSAQEFVEGNDYIKIKHPINNVPKIIEFFSFYCPYCYDLEKNNIIHYIITNKISYKTTLKYFHVDNNLNSIILHVWSMAIAMNVEHQVILSIFHEIQNKHIIYNYNTFKKIFIIKTKINSKIYDKFWNSFLVQTIINKQNKTFKLIHLKKIPTILINGRFIINNIYYTHINSIKQIIKIYTKLINFLINKQ